MWSRRAQEYEAKINSGDIVAIAEVVRDLFRSDTQPEQSYSERQLYEAALDRLSREISAVQRVTETEAVKEIEAALAKGPRRGPKPAEARPKPRKRWWRKRRHKPLPFTSEISKPGGNAGLFLLKFIAVRARLDPISPISHAAGCLADKEPRSRVTARFLPALLASYRALSAASTNGENTSPGCGTVVAPPTLMVTHFRRRKRCAGAERFHRLAKLSRRDARSRQMEFQEV